MTFLLDTNVLSELRKGERAQPQVLTWFASLEDEEIFLSVLTLGEIRNGIERIRRRDEDQARALDAWLHRVMAEHSDRILSIAQDVADSWGRLGVPDAVPVVDGLLAATALVHGLTLATRNVDDVAGTGVMFVNPFAG